MTLPKVFLAVVALGFGAQCLSQTAALNWPEVPREARPGAYWWWLGSAVDKANISKELQRYREAGMGAVHIIPIYGAKGWEEKYIPYLSPQWLEMLRHTIDEGKRLGLNVDMTTGTGWCFGGPAVTDLEANAAVVAKTFKVPANTVLKEKLDPKTIQALVAFGPDGKPVDLASKVGQDGSVSWTAPGSEWTVYAISQRPSGQKVKRAAPGGGGHMLNLLYARGVSNFLASVDSKFAGYDGPWPRAMYHDSYEYRSDWAPDFFGQFEKRRGYRLQDEFPVFFGKEESERAARIKCDYRETVSDLMAEESLPAWAAWCHRRGIITRNQAHGSPGNLLDLYAAADIPETEMFHTDRNRLVSKFASSAAHVTGKNLVASETGTWLKEHFTETLADMKYLLDDLFLSGVNHIYYHGTCYSPDEASWPGWLFYASYEMNPRNSVWRDVPALNAYAARCQAVLQAGQPDNDILLYWPIHDRWHNAKGMVQPFTVHARDWLEGQPIGKLAETLWRRGYAFDYASDRQLQSAAAQGGGVKVPGGKYRAIVVPACERMPLPTMRKLLALAGAGATIIFENRLPADVPGWKDMEKRRAELREMAGSVKLKEVEGKQWSQAQIGAGRVLAGAVEGALAQCGIQRESLTDHAGLMFIRRAVDGGKYYFVANRGETPAAGWFTLATAGKAAGIMDPMSGNTGLGAVRSAANGNMEVYLQLEAGESLIVRTFAEQQSGSAWDWVKASGAATEIAGTWQVKFVQGGPQIPATFQTTKLGSWTELGDAEAQRFAGTALYSITFDAPASASAKYYLDLGKVCQSARVRLNEKAVATLLIPPFRAVVADLKPKGNLLEVEVTNVSANRIRDLDRRKVAWRTFTDINFVNIDYKPFDASNWPLTDSGLLGPVRLVPVEKVAGN